MKQQAKAQHRKPSDALVGLNLRQRKYVQGVVDGKTKKHAALEAGYSVSAAENAAAIIEGSDVCAAFEKLIRHNVDPKKIAQRLAEGLDATETKVFQHNGEVTLTCDVVDYEQRRKYIALAAKLGGYHVDREEVQFTDVMSDLSDEELIARNKKLLGRLEKKM